MKEKARLCYIIPQTFLINADFDVLRFHLSKSVTIEKMFTFSGKMFLGRGLKQNKPIPTSSLVLIASRASPASDHMVEVVNYHGVDSQIEDTFANMSKGINVTIKRIPQHILLKNITNWNFIKLNAEQLGFYESYTQNSDDFSNYYVHTSARPKFNSTFIFDGGYSIDEKKFLLTPPLAQPYYQRPKLNSKYWSIKQSQGYWPNERIEGHPMYIDLRQGNQGYSFLDSQYKVIWSYNATDKFFYTDEPIIWARNTMLGIASNNRLEILYLFAILNSKVTKYILNTFVKIDQEDTRTILVSLQIVKKQLRVPRITGENELIKETIIKQVEELLTSESKTLSDFVDFSAIMMQRFDDVQVSGNTLVLIHGNRKTELPINGDSKLIADTITQKFGTEELKLETRNITLSELRDLQVIDFEKQAKLKDYIDDLVFALYFNIPLKEVSLDKAEDIRKACSTSKYYDIL